MQPYLTSIVRASDEHVHLRSGAQERSELPRQGQVTLANQRSSGPLLTTPCRAGPSEKGARE